MSNHTISIMSTTSISPLQGNGLAADVWNHNFLAPTHPRPAVRPAPAARAIVLRSGWAALSQHADAPGTHASSIKSSIDPTPALPAWMPAQRAQWDALAPLLTSEHAPGSLILWPLWSDVISDVPSLLSFLRGSAGSSWRFLLDPAGLLAPSMHADAKDHLPRLLSLCAHPSCAGVLLRDLSREGPPAVLAPVSHNAYRDALAAAWKFVQPTPACIVLPEGGEPGASAAALAFVDL